MGTFNAKDLMFLIKVNVKKKKLIIQEEEMKRFR